LQLSVLPGTYQVNLQCFNQPEFTELPLLAWSGKHRKSINRFHFSLQSFSIDIMFVSVH